MAIKRTRVWDMGAVSFDTIEQYSAYMNNFNDEKIEYEQLRKRYVNENKILSYDRILNNNLITFIFIFNTIQDAENFELEIVNTNITSFLQNLGWSLVSQDETYVE